MTASQVSAQALTPERRAELEAEYAKLQQEIAEWEKVLTDTQAKKNTIQGDVTALNAQIKQAEAQIKQRAIAIGNLSTEIKQKSARIGELEGRIDRGKEALASLMRRKNEIDDYSFVELALAADEVSVLMTDADLISSIHRELDQEFHAIRTAKAETEEERAALKERQDAELDAKYVVESKKKAIASDEREKQRLLAITKNQEKEYQKVLTERRAKAEQIRSALFELRDSQGIPFGTALEYATYAEGQTGVRAAFILAILRQESNLGVNVGQCLLVDKDTGAGKGKNSGKEFKNLMKASRDVEPFLDITARLGRDPYATPVSCPVAGGGFGGAMGPSQFIPSTWKIYESRLATALSVGTPDPWNAKHAVMATALYMKDLGAAKQTYSAEREAAARYYAGSNWQRSGLGYAASVLKYAEEYQENIDFLKGI